MDHSVDHSAESVTVTPKALTPIHNLIQTPSLSILDTPLGQSDRHPKVQLCLEYRNKEIVKSRSKRIKKVLEVTVMWVKNLPQSEGRRPNPIVKLQLAPGDVIHTTEPKTEKNEAQYIKIFEFHIDTNKDLKGSFLEIQVCDRKITRNAKSFGNVTIPLDDLKLGQPVVKWHHLKTQDQHQDGIKMTQENEVKKKITKKVTAPTRQLSKLSI